MKFRDAFGISSFLHHLDKRLDKIMTDISALQAATAALTAEVGAAVTALNDLAAKVAAGETVSQADIDAISASLTAATDSLSTAVTTDDPAPTPPVA